MTVMQKTAGDIAKLSDSILSFMDRKTKFGLCEKDEGNFLEPPVNSKLNTSWPGVSLSLLNIEHRLAKTE